MANVREADASELSTRLMVLLEPADVVLDIGCGIRPQELIVPLVHVCCEPFGEYAAHLLRSTAAAVDRDFLVLQATWAEAVRMFPPRSVDTVFLIDVIEHLDKPQAQALLDATVPLARHQIAIFTPLGFMPQSHPDGVDAWGFSGAAWQEHRSGWTPADFGSEWEILVAPEFHRADNLGRPLDRPFGAFWALRTSTEEQVGGNAHAVRRRISAIRQAAAARGGALAAGVADSAVVAAGIQNESLLDGAVEAFRLVADLREDTQMRRVVEIMRLVAGIRRPDLLAPVLALARTIAAAKSNVVVRAAQRLLSGG